MKTFFTIVEKHTNQNLGINIFTDENIDFHQNRHEFVFGAKSVAEGISVSNNTNDERRSSSLQQLNLKCIDEDLPKERIPLSTLIPDIPSVTLGLKSPQDDNVNIKYQLYFMINNMKHHFNEKKTERTIEKTISMNVSKKFKYYNQTIKNMFLNSNIKKTIKEIFYKSQRTYHAFICFAQIIRIKHAKMNITTDLSMTPIEPNQKNITIIYQNNTKYPFTLSDLINIILTSITNAPSLFPEPLVPKNPYNNIHFSKAILYHIYWTIKSSNILMPPLINSYFWSCFNLKKFIVNNEQAVRDYTIKKYVMNSPVTVLYDDILQMLDISLVRRNRIDIDPDFPKTKLVEIMKPYLFLYIMKNDGISGTEKRRVSNIMFKREILNFIKYNPNFGRKTVKYRKTTSSCFFSRSCPNNVPTPTFNSPSFTPSFTPFSSTLEQMDALALQAAEEQSSARTPVKTFVFNTVNPGLTITKIEKMYKNYMSITPKNINEYDSESDNDSDNESDNSFESYTSVDSEIIHRERGLGSRIHVVDPNHNPFAGIRIRGNRIVRVEIDEGISENAANFIIESFQNREGIESNIIYTNSEERIEEEIEPDNDSIS